MLGYLQTQYLASICSVVNVEVLTRKRAGEGGVASVVRSAKYASTSS